MTVEMADKTQRLFASASTACAGFSSPPDANAAWEYSVASAEQGDGAAIMNFVGMKIGLDQIHPSSTAEGWLAYKELAPPLLQRAMDAGDPEAYEFAAAQYAQRSEAGRILPYDPVKAVAIYRALRTVSSDEYRQTLDININARLEQLKLSPEQLAGADAQAARISTVLAARNPAPLSGVSQEDRASNCDLD